MIFSLNILYRIYNVVLISEAYPEPCKTPKMELFVKIVNGWKSLIFEKNSILDIRESSEYFSGYYGRGFS